MIALTLQERIIENKDWATILFLICFVVIVINKTLYENQFQDFIRLLFSKKYNSVYKDSSNLYSTITISMFFIQLFSFSFSILIILTHLDKTDKTNWILFIRIATALMVFILTKFYFEKIIATVFNIEEFAENYNLKKVVYRTFIGLIYLPIVLILYYNNNVSFVFIQILLGLTLLFMVYFYIISLLNYQKVILSKLFYFILYLCTLEIGPYYFLYHWFIKK